MIERSTFNTTHTLFGEEPYLELTIAEQSFKWMSDADPSS